MMKPEQRETQSDHRIRLDVKDSEGFSNKLTTLIFQSFRGQTERKTTQSTVQKQGR